MSQGIFGLGRRLARDEGGAVLIYVSVALTVFMGFAALIIDGGRLFTLDTEMQSAADAIALAGAAELDGNADAQTRADAAMANLVQNSQTFGTGAAAITGFSRRFLSALPDDDQPLSDATVAPDAASSRFVEVKMANADRRAIDTMFATAIGGDLTAATGAVAVAGFTSAVCKFTPLFICNPYEGTGTSIFAAIENPDERRKLIELKKGPSGGGAQYFPGNFGLLEPGTGPGANEVRESLAKVDPGACFAQTGVEMQTGTIASIRTAVNTRFDIYDPPFQSNRSDPDYRPAENVTKGYMLQNPTACSGEPDPNTPPVSMAMPLDDCSVTSPACGTLGGGGVHVWGNGVWDFEAYWDMNHGNRDGNFDGADPALPNSWTIDYAGGNLPSRYEVYRWEVETSFPNNIPDQTLQGGEKGRPQCYSGPDPSDDPDRRIIYAAVLNCGELNVTGGSSDSVPALTFIKMFITRPMAVPGSPGEDDGSIYVEMVDVVDPGTDAEVVHDIVQLYR